MIFSLLIFHNQGRMSSITRVLHTTTLGLFYLMSSRPFRSFPKSSEGREEYMAGIKNIVQEFWRTSSEGVSFFAMYRLFNILQLYFDIVSVYATPVDLADKNYRYRKIPIPGSGTIPLNGILMTESELNLRYCQCLMDIERCLINQ